MHFKEISIRNRVYNYHFHYLIKTKTKNKKIEIKNTLIDEKSYKDLIIYFTRYDRGKSIRMLRLYYHELMGKIDEHERNLMVEDFMLDKILKKIKMMISIIIDDIKILTETNDELSDDVTLKNVVILITCVMKDDNKFY